MIKKVLFNILLNLAIIVLVMSLAWSYKNGFYLYIFAGLPPLTMMVYLKIRLVKSVKDLTKNKQK